MIYKNGSVCEVNGKRIVGSEVCIDCLFNNDSYNPPAGYQCCVFPWKEDINRNSEEEEQYGKSRRFEN